MLLQEIKIKITVTQILPNQSIFGAYNPVSKYNEGDFNLYSHRIV